MAGLLDEPYIGYPQLRRRSEQSLLGGTPRGLLNTTPQISADTLRKLGEQLINIPTSATRAITDPQLFARLLGITPNQQLSGFSAGYAGVPAKPPSDIGVVDPRNIDYSKGYSSGEEMGMMTALAAPLAPLARPVGRAMGEQAYRMTEDMLQRQGLMPSITAYHGTPYNIQGGFDISKIGTGEGAQAYGRGMYYAENPAVATAYKNILSKPEFTKTAEGIELRGQLPRMLEESYSELVAKNGIQQTNYGDVTDIVGQRLDRQMKDALKANDMDWYNKTADMKMDLARFKENPPPNVGNLYKVDIPDQYVPNMLDWDKPLNQQTKEVQEGLAKLGIKTDTKKLNEFDDALLNALKGDANNPLPKQPINPTGEDIYNKFIQGNPQLTSQKLNEVGIKGIRYLDEGSRNQAVQPYYQLIRKSDNSVYTQMQSLENAKEFVKDAKKQGVEFEISEPIDKRTSNFVVFDPTDVKILEKNSQKVEQVFEGSMPQYKDYENLASVFEKAGLKTQETGSSKSGSKYVNIYDPVSGENLTVRFADHPQTGSAISLHGPADIEIGEPFKNKSWKDAINPILDTINKSRREYGDELLTINQKVESLLD